MFLLDFPPAIPPYPPIPLSPSIPPYPPIHSLIGKGISTGSCGGSHVVVVVGNELFCLDIQDSSLHQLRFTDNEFYFFSTQKLQHLKWECCCI